MAKATSSSDRRPGWMTRHDSLTWRLIIPVPIAIVIAVVVIWASVPQIVDSMATTDAVLADQQVAAQFKAIRAYYTENVVNKVVRSGAFQANIDHQRSETGVYVRSGDGGAGAVSFRREKFIEFGGPDGGDGGRGGDVAVECADGLNTLIDFRYQQHFKAKTGIHGMGRNRAGGRGPDAVLKVPVGSAGLRRGKRGNARRPQGAWRAGSRRRGRQWRLRQRPFHDLRPIARRAAPIPARAGSSARFCSG